MEIVNLQSPRDNFTFVLVHVDNTIRKDSPPLPDVSSVGSLQVNSSVNLCDINAVSSSQLDDFMTKGSDFKVLLFTQKSVIVKKEGIQEGILE